jgi:SAM-dependent methyltransferase
MLNIDLPKMRSAAATSKRGAVIEWPTADGTGDRPAGDEPGRDAPGRDAEQRWFALAVAPWLTPQARVVEIGPGTGAWTVRIAPLVREIVVVDSSDAALEQARRRLQAGEIRNASYVLASGRDLQALSSDRFDLVLGNEVFSQLLLDEAVHYLGEIARVLRDDGVAVLPHGTNDAGGTSRDGLDRMYGRFGLRVESVWADPWTTIVTARRPSDSIVPRLEQVLRLAAAADDERALDDAMRAMTAIGRELNDRLAPLATALLATAPGRDRFAVIQQIRRLVRG